MHKAICDRCGGEFPATRKSRRFCSNTCKKAAARIEATGKASRDDAILAALKSRGLIGKLWPVLSTDTSPAIYGLMVPVNLAVDEVNAALDEPTSAQELTAVLRRARIFGAGAADDFLRFRGGDGKRRNRSYGAKTTIRRKSYQGADFGPVTSPQAIENIGAKNRKMADRGSALEAA